MKKIAQKEIVDVYCSVVKEKRKYSNCFFNIKELQEKINNNFFVAYEGEDWFIIIDKNSQLSQLYFICNSWNWLEHLGSLRDEHKDIVVEINKRGALDVYEILNEKMMMKKVYKRLRKTQKTPIENIQNVEYCGINDYDELRGIIDETFETLGDHIPNQNELEEFIKKKCIICIREDEHIKGFVIFEDKGKTSYIRMICVAKDSQGKKIGERLMNMYFQIHAECVSFTLWYNTKNMAAYNLYLKYGYEDEEIYNYIFTMKN